MFASILAHNLTHELQIQLTPRARVSTASERYFGVSVKVKHFAGPSSNTQATLFLLPAT